MKRSTLILLKTLTWAACLWPAGLLTYGAVTNTLGADPTGTIEFTTGYDTLLLLILSLAVTPLRRLIPRLSWLIKFRRLLGLFAFFYGTVHMLGCAEGCPGAGVCAMAASPQRAAPRANQYLGALNGHAALRLLRSRLAARGLVRPGIEVEIVLKHVHRIPGTLVLAAIMSRSSNFD